MKQPSVPKTDASPPGYRKSWEVAELLGFTIEQVAWYIKRGYLKGIRFPRGSGVNRRFRYFSDEEMAAFVDPVQRPPDRNLSPQYARDDLCYLAGFLDGEGCLSVQVDSRPGKWLKVSRYVARLSVANTQAEIIDWIDTTFGPGTRSEIQKKAHWKTSLEWTITGKRVHHLLKALLPYLRVKREQAQLLLTLEEAKASREGGSVIPADMTRWEAIAVEVRHLNRKGSSSGT
jgi:hypothetical protein